MIKDIKEGIKNVLRKIRLEKEPNATSRNDNYHDKLNTQWTV